MDQYAAETRKPEKMREWAQREVDAEAMACRQRSDQVARHELQMQQSLIRSEQMLHDRRIADAKARPPAPESRLAPSSAASRSDAPARSVGVEVVSRRDHVAADAGSGGGAPAGSAVAAS